LLKPFQRADPEIDLANANDLLLLCLEFGTSSSQSEIEKFLRDNGRSPTVLLIPRLLNAPAEGDCSAVENALRANFFDVIDDVRLLDLPLNVLMRVVPFRGIAAEQHELIFGSLTAAVRGVRFCSKVSTLRL
jgi:hypothetical protein